MFVIQPTNNAIRGRIGYPKPRAMRMNELAIQTACCFWLTRLGHPLARMVPLRLSICQRIHLSHRPLDSYTSGYFYYAMSFGGSDGAISSRSLGITKKPVYGHWGASEHFHRCSLSSRWMRTMIVCLRGSCVVFVSSAFPKA